MTLQDKLKRCELVFKYVHRFPNEKSLAEIVEYVKDAFDDFKDVKSSKIKSNREFGRLLELIETEFEIRIKPNSFNKYAIVNNTDDVEELIEFYETAESIGVSTGNLNKLKKMKDFIEFSNSKDNAKPEHISQLLDLCIKSHEVVFDYQKYGEEEATIRKVQPYKIKQYQGSWYLIGIEPDLAEKEPHPEIVKFRAYGLDRMHNLEKGEHFKRNKATDKAYEDHYADVIGIVNGYHYQTGTNIKAEEIRLRVDKFNWNYINALPWHSSQKQVNKTDNYVEFKLFIKPTSELVQLILRWSPKVQVLEPASLKDAVLVELKKSVALYI